MVISFYFHILLRVIVHSVILLLYSVFLTSLLIWRLFQYSLHKKGNRVLFTTALIIFFIFLVVGIFLIPCALCLGTGRLYMDIDRILNPVTPPKTSPSPSGPTESGPSGSSAPDQGPSGPTPSSDRPPRKGIRAQLSQDVLQEEELLEKTRRITHTDYNPDTVFNIERTGSGSYLGLSSNKQRADRKVHKERLESCRASLLEIHTGYIEAGMVNANVPCPKISKKIVYNKSCNIDRPASFPVYAHHIEYSIEYQFVQGAVWGDPSPYSRVIRQYIWDNNAEFRMRVIKKGEEIAS